jgi:hypothetical protein
VKSLEALTTLFLLVTLCGCGGAPTEDAAKQYAQQNIKGEAVFQNEVAEDKNLITLVNLHKTNAETGHNQSGVENYIMKFEGEIEFTEDCFSYGGLLVSRRDAGKINSNGGPVNGGPVKKGQRAKILGSVEFKKTEKGWQPSGLHAGA